MKLPRTVGPGCRRLAGRPHRGGARIDQGRGSSRPDRERGGRRCVTGQAPAPHRAVREARSRCSTFAFGNYPWPLA